MPITEYIEEQQIKNPNFNIEEPGMYCKTRTKNMHRFEREIGDRVRNPFHVLYNFLLSKRDFTLEMETKNSPAPDLCYEYLLDLIPAEFGVN